MNRNRSAPGPRLSRGALLAAVVLALAHFLWLALHQAPAIMSPDANGYVVQARLIAMEGKTSFVAASPVQYVGMHWLETTGGTFQSRYPAGLPVLLAAAWKLGGLAAALWVNPLLASATVLLVFFLARRVAPGPYALLAAAVVATIPVANQHALDADAHVAAAFFLVAGIHVLLRFVDAQRPAIGLLAGLLLGAVPTIRYPEAIVGISIAAWLLWRVRPMARAWPAVVGAAFPIGALLIHNASAYGAFWRTGYALTNEQTGFGFSYFASHVLPYLQGLGGQGLALMFAFGAAGLAGMAFDARRRDEGLLFAGLVVPLLLLYMAYYFGGGGPGGAAGNLRFLIPIFPFFAVAGAWLLARVARVLGPPGRAAAIAVAALQLIVGIGTTHATLVAAKSSLGSAARAQAMAIQAIPAGSVVILDRQLAESFDATGRWKLAEESLVSGMMGLGGPGGFGGPGGGRGGFRPGGGGPGGFDPAGGAEDAPSPMQRGKNRAQQERYADLSPAERRARAWSDVVAWAGGQPVYWIARSLDVVDNALPSGADFQTVAEMDAPMMLGPGGAGGPMPGAGGRGGMMGPGRGPGRAGGRGFIPPGAGGPAGRAPGFPVGGGRLGNAEAGTKLRILKLTLANP